MRERCRWKPFAELVARRSAIRVRVLSQAMLLSEENFMRIRLADMAEMW